MNTKSIHDLSLKEVRNMTRLSQKGFAEKYNIPLRTLQNWEGKDDARKCPQYLLTLIFGDVLTREVEIPEDLEKRFFYFLDNFPTYVENDPQLNNANLQKAQSLIIEVLNSRNKFYDLDEDEVERLQYLHGSKTILKVLVDTKLENGIKQFMKKQEILLDQVCNSYIKQS